MTTLRKAAQQALEARTETMSPEVVASYERGGWTPLYTAPPPRKPLSDEELRSMWAAYAPLVGGVIEFARAIERAHGIGGSE